MFDYKVLLLGKQHSSVSPMITETGTGAHLHVSFYTSVWEMSHA